MNKQKRKLKALVLLLGLGTAMLTASSVQAQGVFGNMLDNYYAEKEESSQSNGPLLRGHSIDDNTGSGISNYGIGETAPLSSGIILLIGAGIGYVALKKKEDEQ